MGRVEKEYLEPSLLSERGNSGKKQAPSQRSQQYRSRRQGLSGGRKTLSVLTLLSPVP